MSKNSTKIKQALQSRGKGAAEGASAPHSFLSMCPFF